MGNRLVGNRLHALIELAGGFADHDGYRLGMLLIAGGLDPITPVKRCRNSCGVASRVRSGAIPCGKDAMTDKAIHPRSRGGSPYGRDTTVRRVRDLLSASIRGGYLPADERLVEDLLIESLGASRSAVRQALQTLAEEGFLTRRQRVGTVVTPHIARLSLTDTVPVDSESSVITLRLIDQRTTPTSRLLRDRLRTEDETVRMVENLFLMGGVPIGVRTAYFTHDITFTAYDGPIDMSTVAAELFGATIGLATTEVGATAADGHTARLLKMALAAPVLTRDQVLNNVDGRPIEVVFDQYRADRVSFVATELPLTELVIHG